MQVENRVESKMGNVVAREVPTEKGAASDSEAKVIQFRESAETVVRSAWEQLTSQSAPRSTYAEQICHNECVSWSEEEVCNNKRICETICTAGHLVCTYKVKSEKVCTFVDGACRLVCENIPECRTVKKCTERRNDCTDRNW